MFPSLSHSAGPRYRVRSRRQTGELVEPIHVGHVGRRRLLAVGIEEVDRYPVNAGIELRIDHAILVGVEVHMPDKMASGGAPTVDTTDSVALSEP